MSDPIERQAAIDAFYTQADDDGWWTGTAQDMEELLKGLPSEQPENTKRTAETVSSSNGTGKNITFLSGQK